MEETIGLKGQTGWEQWRSEKKININGLNNFVRLTHRGHESCQQEMKFGKTQRGKAE